MNQTIEDQLNTIERALGERMIEHALVIVRTWLNELGENNPYEQAFCSIQQRYYSLFERWLSGDDAETDAKMNELTGETYQLSDAVYIDIRLLRGLSPSMHGFNPQQMASVMHYFANCVKMKEEDFTWLHRAMNDPNQAAAALMAVGALAKNLRECFDLKAMLQLIECMKAENSLLAEQCIAYIYTLLIQYDIRIDFFPQVQKAFVDALQEIDPEGDRAYEILCALVHSCHPKWSEKTMKESMEHMEDMPDDVRNLLSLLDKETDATVSTWMPKSEQEYMQGLIQMFPDTWLCSVLIGEHEERATNLAGVYLSVGRMDLLWDHPDIAEKCLVATLRQGEDITPMDYINYAHCLMLKGDRLMAFENYRIARNMCKNPRAFLNLFRPDRSQLVDHGVPVEQIYLMEDRLLKTDA
jgi:tetratricopeptide (TPR) repeat protein